MRAIEQASALALALLLSGCATAVDARVAPSVAEVQAAKRLTEAEAQWRAHGPPRYTIKVHYSSFLLRFGCSTQTFRVSSGSSSTLNSSECGARPDKLGSVPALFRFARELLAEKRGDVSAAYDPVYGYPTEFYVARPGLEDNFFLFKVVEFAPEKSGP
jgi:hypothetical protein